MKYYRMGRIVGEDATLLDQVSHDMALFSTGNPLIDYENDDENGEPFKGPLICKLDEEFIDGKMATFYTNPALISTKEFYKALLETGIDNIEMFTVVIRDDVHNKSTDDYVLLNILGRVSCANMDESEYNMLGDEVDDDMNVIDKLVLDSNKLSGFDLFLVHEDTDCIVISEKVYKHLKSKSYDDVYFEELDVV